MTFQSFRGDFDSLAVLMQQSWASDAGAFLYTPTYLRSVMKSPNASPFLAPTLYEGGHPRGFVSGSPRTILLAGKRASIIICANLCVAPTHQKLGLGASLLGELVTRARAAGFDGMMLYCVANGPVNGMVLNLGRAREIAIPHPHSVAHFSRPLFPKNSAQEVSAPATPREDLAALLMELTAEVERRTSLARQWTHDEAEWKFGREGGVSAHLVVGSRRGLITGYLTQMAAGERPRCLVIDDILWGALEDGERRELVRRLLEKAVTAGARLAVAPDLGYADLAPFHDAGFRKSNRTLNAYLSVWSAGFPIATLPSMYLDVF